MTISQELQEVYTSGKGDTILHTLSLSRSTFSKVYYFVRNHEDFQANLENSGPLVTFEKFAFEFEVSPRDQNGKQSIRLQMDGISREIVEELETAIDGTNEPVLVTYRIYLNSDNAGPQNDPPQSFFLVNATANENSVTGNAQAVGLVNRKFPNTVYTKERFPSLFI